MSRSILNREWHAANRMPANATHEQRLAWHAGHAANCACREMPAAIRAELERRGMMPEKLATRHADSRD
ncbi:MAG TPA: hypothetical protein GX405_12090 [Rhizobiales bacterium]|nr:hypothetical protein [Hyphomicrobiales bacterium]